MNTKFSFSKKAHTSLLLATATLLLLSMQCGIFADDATWLSSPVNGNWNNNNNWNPNTGYPGTTATNVATFGVSNITAVYITATPANSIAGITFNSGASSFTTTVEPGIFLTISGTGITNNSVTTQHFVTAVDGSGNFGQILFTNSATAGSMTSFTNNGGTVSGANGGLTVFESTSTADHATITNNGGTVSGAFGGATDFVGASTADHATITSHAATSGAFGGFTGFFNTSTADSATLIANGGVGAGGSIAFFDASTGGTARVEVFGNGSNLDISSHNSAAMFIGSIEGSGNVFLGSRSLVVGGNGMSTTFSGVIQDGGIGGGTGGSLDHLGSDTLTLTGANTYSGGTFVDLGILNIRNATALGTTASGTFLNPGATLQIQGGITVGAEALTIQGAGASGATGALENVRGTNNYGGLVTLAAASTISSDSGILNLTNTGTITGATFGLTLTGAGNGSIASVIGTTTGTLTKSGTGTWTLTGNNTYTGTTSVNAGTLLINGNQSAATGAVTVNNSGTTLGGSGTIGGTVTVNSGANLSPGNQHVNTFGQVITSPGILNTGSVTLNSGSNFRVDINGPMVGTQYDQLNVTGTVMLNSGNLVLTVGGFITVGEQFTIINNDLTDPVAGTFAQGGSVTSNNNTFSINYAGGDGNDVVLTATVVPEPSTWMAGVLAIAFVVYTQRRRFGRILRRA